MDSVSMPAYTEPASCRPSRDCPSPGTNNDVRNARPGDTGGRNESGPVCLRAPIVDGTRREESARARVVSTVTCAAAMPGSVTRTTSTTPLHMN